MSVFLSLFLCTMYFYILQRVLKVALCISRRSTVNWSSVAEWQHFLYTFFAMYSTNQHTIDEYSILRSADVEKQPVRCELPSRNDSECSLQPSYTRATLIKYHCWCVSAHLIYSLTHQYKSMARPSVTTLALPTYVPLLFIQGEVVVRPSRSLTLSQGGWADEFLHVAGLHKEEENNRGRRWRNNNNNVHPPLDTPITLQ